MTFAPIFTPTLQSALTATRHRILLTNRVIETLMRQPQVSFAVFHGLATELREAEELERDLVEELDRRKPRLVGAKS